jgi:hypothetical protein
MIQDQLTKLKEMKPKVRHFSMFGDDNQAAIEAQIQVIEKDMTEDDIYDEYESYYDIHSALEARQWLDGDSEYVTLTENWEGLIPG